MDPNFENKILTIAIPTYNRAEFLRKNLNFLFPQWLKFKKYVHVIVSNNASKDNTDDVIRDFQKKGFLIQYLNNVENIGAERNFLQCFYAVQTKYFLILSDDDILVDNGLETILKVLFSRDNFGIIFLSPYAYQQDIFAERPKRTSKGVYYFDDLSRFIKRLHINFTFISSNVINKSLVNPNLGFERFLKTELVQLSWTFSALFNSKQNAWIYNFLIAGKADNSGGYNFFKVFVNNTQKIFWYFIHNQNVPVHYLYIYNNASLRYLARFVYFIRRDEKDSPRIKGIFRSLIHVYRNYPFFWYGVFPLMQVPLSIVKLIWIIHDLFRDIKRKLLN